MSKVEYNHFVPQFVMRGFENDKKLFVLEFSNKFPEGRIFQQSIKKLQRINAVRRLYTPEQEREYSVYEHALSLILKQYLTPEKLKKGYTELEQNIIKKGLENAFYNLNGRNRVETQRTLLPEGEYIFKVITSSEGKYILEDDFMILKDYIVDSQFDALNMKFLIKSEKAMIQPLSKNVTFVIYKKGGEIDAIFEKEKSNAVNRLIMSHPSKFTFNDNRVNKQYIAYNEEILLIVQRHINKLFNDGLEGEK